MTTLQARTRAFKDELHAYCIREYMNIININGTKQLSAADKKSLNKAEITNLSHLWRIAINVQQLRHAFIMPKTNIVTACFKVTFRETTTIYAYLHSAIEQDGGSQHRFICCSPTFRSQDGEYRHRMIPWPQFTALRSHFEDTFNMIDALITKKFDTHQTQYHIDLFYDTSLRFDAQEYRRSIDSDRLAIWFHCIAWFCDFHLIRQGIMENHIHPAYQYVMYQDDDLPTYTAIMEKLGLPYYDLLANKMSCYYPDVTLGVGAVSAYVECGQKIFPVTIFEALRTGDVRFDVWREMYLTNLCSNMVLNLVTPCFPFINNWFYVHNGHPGIFDNMSMHEKYEQSKLATDIHDKLEEANNMTNYQLDSAKGKVNFKFHHLSHLITRSDIFVDSRLRLADILVCMTVEHTGRTLRDIPALLESEQPPPEIVHMFADDDSFAKHIFEYVYSFYCMNTKVGILHGDVHMNSVTLYQI